MRKNNDQPRNYLTRCCKGGGLHHFIVAVRIVDLDEIVRGEFAENAIRKDFLPSEIDAIRRAMEPAEKAAAKERQETGENQHSEGGGKFPQASKGETRNKIGEFAGVSGVVAGY